jgi:dihydrofolate reductase
LLTVSRWKTIDGDVWVFGGGEVARAFLAAGRLDTLELCIVPHLIGAALFDHLVDLHEQPARDG